MNNKKDHSIAKSLQDETFVFDTSLHTFQDDLRTAERERLQSNQKRKELLDTLKNKFKTETVAFDRTEIRTEVLNAIHQGNAQEIDSVINILKRDLKMLSNKNNISEFNQQSSGYLLERIHTLKTKRQLYEKLTGHLSQIQTLDFEASHSEAVEKVAASNQSLDTVGEKITLLYNNLHVDIANLVKELDGDYQAFEDRLLSDLEEDSRLKELFFICIGGLPIESKKKFLHIYSTKCKYSVINLRIRQQRKLIETLASKSRLISEKVHLHTRKIARKLTDEGKPQDAINELKYALTLYKDSVETLRQLEHLYSLMGDDENLSRVLIELVRLKPQNLLLCKRAGLLCEKLNKWQQSETLYKNAVKHHPDDLVVFKHYIKVQFYLHKFSGLVEVLKPKIQLYEDDAEMNQWLGIAAMECKQFTDSIPYLKKAYLLQSTVNDVFYYLINALRKTNQQEEALSLLQQALHSDPQSLPLKLLIGSVYKENGDHTQALEIFESILNLQRPGTSLLLSIGQLKIDMGQDHQALKYFQQAFELNPTNIEAGLEYAKHLQKLGQTHDAESILNNLVNVHPASVELKQELIAVYISANNWKKATKLMKGLQAMQTDFQHPHPGVSS